MGPALIVITCAVTIVLYGASKGGKFFATDIFILISQISALLGFVILSWNYILAVRTGFLEKLFSGLDKVYKLHSIIGQIGFILIVNHLLFLILAGLPANLTKLYLVPSYSNLPYMLGILAFYSLLALIYFSLFIDLPYRIWKRTHEWMGLVIILGSLHTLLITSDVSRFVPLKIWMLAWGAAGIMAFLYKRYLYYWLKPKNNYAVSDAQSDREHLVLEITATNENKKINFSPGQFAFFSFGQDASDEHPFSILSQDGAKIKIATKLLGPFTARLFGLKQGDLITVHGPFGSFGEGLEKFPEHLWVSGGIGITPFLSMVKSLKPYQKATLIHSRKSNDPDVISRIFRDYTDYFPQFTFYEHFSDKFGRLNENILPKLAVISPNTPVHLCGPKPFMEDIAEKISGLGVKNKRIVFEDFDMK